MTRDDTSAYGLWSLVILNSAVSIFFAFSFRKPRARRDFGADYDRYAADVPAWFPRLGGHAPADRPSAG